jgi:divalent metal cation (Fe/Co/Zn/Cd) transporter
MWLAHETKNLLIRESASQATIKGVRAILQANDSIDHVNEALTMRMGPDFILANIIVDFDDTKTANDIENVVAKIDETIKREFPQMKRILVEAEKRRKHTQK